MGTRSLYLELVVEMHCRCSAVHLQCMCRGEMEKDPEFGRRQSSGRSVGRIP